jgi:branched-chain amino acid aminotransferase
LGIYLQNVSNIENYNKMHHCWFNGQITKVEDAKFHFYDLGILRGYGLFDYFRTYNGKPFQWDWYWERYERSAKFLKIPNPITKSQAFDVVNQLIQLQGGEDCSFRFLLTGGFTSDSITLTKPNLIIVSEDLHHDIPGEHISGIKVMTYEFVRDLPEVKSTDYKHLLILRPEMFEKGFSDVLFHKDGYISELSRSNVFIVNGNTLTTPNENVLEGITRRTVLELAKDDFEIQLRPVTLEETLRAEEVFTTSTTKRVLPITCIDEKVIGTGKIGPKSQLLLDKINNMILNW